jgi:lipopolysaccharide export system protein LptA
MVFACLAALTALGLASLPSAYAQQLDLTHGGPIDITAQDGIEWRQAEQEIIANGDAKAVRGNVTVTADRLTAWYRKKKSADTGVQQAAAPAASPSGGQPNGGQATGGLVGDTATEDSEIYRLQADGNVHIFTQTDQAQGDKAVYDLDQAVMVMTGRNLKLTTPNDVITARDDLEYWPQKHMAVARGDAVVVTTDAKRVAADTLVAYTTDNPPPNGQPAPVASSQTAAADPLGASGKLQRVEAFGHVSIRTPTDTVTGDRGVYVPDTGMARLAGNVQINRGQNQLNGAEADVNMKTGIATLIAANAAGRVHGLVVPNDASNKALANDPAMGPGSAPAKGPAKGQPGGQTGGQTGGQPSSRPAAPAAGKTP